MAFGKLFVTAAAGTVAALLVGVAPASAHECFNTQRSPQANAVIAQHSHGWFDIQVWQLYGIFTGTCDPATTGPCLPVPAQFGDIAAFGASDPDTLIGVILGFAPPAALPPAAAAEFGGWVSFLQSAQAAAAAMGVPTHYLTLANATAAGGADRSAQGVTADGKGIDHFPDVYGDQLVNAYMSVL
jgi:hypothetical protein